PRVRHPPPVPDRLLPAALPGDLRIAPDRGHPLRAARDDGPLAAHRAAVRLLAPRGGGRVGGQGGGRRSGRGRARARGWRAVSVILRADGLSKRFGGLKAVDAVDLELGEGEILGVIGPNGAGKTTLFSMIAGSIPPTSGRVLLNGKVISGASPRRAVHAGVVRTHQIVRPFQNLTVLENVMVGAIYGKGRPLRARERALEELDFCALRDRAPQLPGGLTLAGRKRL